MVFWTCHVFKITPKFDNFVKEVMTKKADHIYEKIDDKQLFFYIEGVTQAYGMKLMKFYVDKPLRIYNREEGYVPVKQTVSVDVCLYEEPAEISNFLAVFGSTENMRCFAYALRVIVSKKVRQSGEYPDLIMVRPLIPIRFRLKGRERELSKHFSNIRELSVKNIKDVYVHGASLRGFLLEESDEYKRYIRDEEISGELNYFGVGFKGRVIMLSSEGKIWTRQGRRELEPDVVKEILKILNNCDAMIIRK
ncbi:MAG: hypothetical protein DRP09_19570 [Candidatus Thorarchaeota archaeon]|nr:MAG: hypothetical protein DRP09_19570 [Candidatus Thorarchaeota archaeon]